ncbi:MAG: hypothetical protein IT371_01510 [Deltaproteobacteria bacterium]|nr:hypothetical protein [Deltaproteobacteria bacterium]
MARGTRGREGLRGRDAQYWWELLTAVPPQRQPFGRYFSEVGTLESLRREGSSPWGEDASLIEGWFAEGERLDESGVYEPRGDARA